MRHVPDPLVPLTFWHSGGSVFCQSGELTEQTIAELARFFIAERLHRPSDDPVAQFCLSRLGQLSDARSGAQRWKWAA